MSEKKLSPQPGLIYDSRLSEDILLTTGCVYACGMICVDKYISSAFMEWICPAMTLIMIICLLSASFLNGCRRRSGFIIYTLLYWLLPAGLLIAAERVSFLRFTAAGMIASAVSRIAVLFPVKWLCEVIHISENIFPFALAGICLAAYLLGAGYSRRIIKASPGD
ncbi:MAG: hypothetical protein ACI4KF_05910 [Huintestinicola sp.]